jgi:hypothetical protein
MKLRPGLHFRSWIFGGVAGGVGAALTFVVLHAILIIPIWSSVFSVGSFARIIIGGFFSAWVGTELFGSQAPSLRSGIKNGALMWTMVLPATLFGLTASLLGFRRALGSVEPVIAIALTVLFSLVVTRAMAPRRSASVALAVSAIVFIGLLGGPFPLFVSRPALGLLIGLLPIFVFAGAIQGAVGSLIFARYESGVTR